MFKSIFKWLDGKKTALGAAAMIVAQFLPAEAIPAMASLVNDVGVAVASIGIVHKGIKNLLGKGE